MGGLWTAHEGVSDEHREVSAGEARQVGHIDRSGANQFSRASRCHRAARLAQERSSDWA
jgi:hypothetical protein